jgi:mRNA interferase RelE/StbE
VYELLIEAGAEREIRKLPRDVAERVVVALKALASSPRPPGCRRIAGAKACWRIRVGDYRAIYEIDDRQRAVRILKVGHRRDVYS